MHAYGLDKYVQKRSRVGERVAVLWYEHYVPYPVQGLLGRLAEAEEARAWLERVVGALESAQSSSVISVKDSNGAPLLEGDSVVVIKDLKVKGGTSDLKRGTLIKKIHL